jgi:FACT complex subunit SSRP1/POB3
LIFKVCNIYWGPICYTHVSPGSDLAFLVSNKTAFEVPLSQISNSNIVGKTEVSLEFTPLEKKNGTSTPSASKRKDADDELVEMRLHIPGTHTKEQEDEDGERMDVDDDDETPAAQAFHDMIKEKADIGQVTGEGIASFAEVTVLTPRYTFLCLLY